MWKVEQKEAAPLSHANSPPQHKNYCDQTSLSSATLLGALHTPMPDSDDIECCSLRNSYGILLLNDDDVHSLVPSLAFLLCIN